MLFFQQMNGNIFFGDPAFVEDDQVVRDAAFDLADKASMVPGTFDGTAEYGLLHQVLLSFSVSGGMGDLVVRRFFLMVLIF